MYGGAQGRINGGCHTNEGAPHHGKQFFASIPKFCNAGRGSGSGGGGGGSLG